MNRDRIIKAVLAMTLPLSGFTALAATSDQVRDSEVRQEQLRSQTQVIAQQIDSVIVDFQKNGLRRNQVCAGRFQLLSQSHGLAVILVGIRCQGNGVGSVEKDLILHGRAPGRRGRGNPGRPRSPPPPGSALDT